jgi:hypothetical protein
MADPLKTNFIVVPIATPLQRVGRGDAQAFVMVSMADDELVDFTELRIALADWPDRQLGRVFFSVRHGLAPGQTIEEVDGEPFPRPVLFSQTELVQLAFEGIARDVGFRSATVDAYLAYKPRPWELIVADFLGNAHQDAIADESPIGDDLVEVYPVSTTMSRFENLSADYAIRIVPAVHELEPTAATEIPKAIEVHLSKLNPDRSGKVVCLVTAPEVGRKANEGFDLLLDNRFWCKQLGFELAGWRQI